MAVKSVWRKSQLIFLMAGMYHVLLQRYTAGGILETQSPKTNEKLCSNRKSLQHNKKNGGVILFWHVPKTGGSTLRSRYKHRNFGNLHQWVDMGLRKRQYLQRKQKLETSFLADTIADNKNGYHGKTLFWEIHGGLSITSLNQDILHWKHLAKMHNKTFFAFTLLRNGPSAAISYFNFYCAPQCPKDEIQFVKNLTNSHRDFIGGARNTWVNYQSRLLYYGNYGPSWTNQTMTGISTEAAVTMYENAELDWVGVTEKLSNMTIPLLDYLIRGTMNQQSKKVKLEKVANDSENVPKVKWDALDAKKQALVKEHTDIDTLLWQRALVDYHWDSKDPIQISSPCTEMLNKKVKT